MIDSVERGAKITEDYFNALTDREKLVICGYFILGMNLANIGRDLSISRERARQLKGLSRDSR